MHLNGNLFSPSPEAAPQVSHFERADFYDKTGSHVGDGDLDKVELSMLKKSLSAGEVLILVKQDCESHTAQSKKQPSVRGLLQMTPLLVTVEGFFLVSTYSIPETKVEVDGLAINVIDIPRAKELMHLDLSRKQLEGQHC